MSLGPCRPIMESCSAWEEFTVERKHVFTMTTRGTSTSTRYSSMVTLRAVSCFQPCCFSDNQRRMPTLMRTLYVATCSMNGIFHSNSSDYNPCKMPATISPPREQTYRERIFFYTERITRNNAVCRLLSIPLAT